jgi:hypothetical protein
MSFSNIPTLVKDGKGWTLDRFAPGQQAFRWDEFERKNATIYVLGCGEHVKIGVTRDIAKRIRQLEAANPLPIVLLGKRTVPLASMLITEAWLHQRFATYRVRGEWFLVSADDVLAALTDAGRFANAYARCCRDWFERDRVRRINRDRFGF